MADPSARELKLIQYLNEAYGKEKQLETVLQAQIQLANAEKTIKKRLQEHLKETKAQARNIERRIKALGGKAEATSLPGPDAVSDVAGAATSLANKALAAAKGPVQALRGSSPQDNLLRNMRDAFWNEAEEIAHYNVIESVANALSDKETAKLAREHRRQEERFQTFIGKQLDKLSKAAVRAEVPARERKPATAASSSRSSSRSTSRSSSRSGAGRKSTARKSSSSGTRKASSTRKSSGSSSRASSSRSTSRSSGSTRKSSGSTARKSSGSTARKSGTTRAASSRSSGSTRKSSGSSRAKSSRSSANGASASKSGSSRSRSTSRSSS
jgi:ferritin-like metal-binding protein YciE